MDGVAFPANDRPSYNRGGVRSGYLGKITLTGGQLRQLALKLPLAYTKIRQESPTGAQLYPQLCAQMAANWHDDKTQQQTQTLASVGRS